MKILLISDVESKFIWDHFQPEKFKDIELVISCGDLKAEYLSFIATMCKAPVFYVNGNHNASYVTNPPEGCDCIEDRFVKYKGLRIIGLGGSKKYNKGLFQYTEDEMKKRMIRLIPQIFWNKGFDILVTHAAPYGFGDDKDPCHEGFKIFLNILDRYYPKYLVHGHTHLNYGKKLRINQYNKTIIINSYEKYILDYDDAYINSTI